MKSARPLCPYFVVLFLTSGAKSGCGPQKRWQLSWHTVAWAPHQGATAHLPEMSERCFTKKSLFKNSQQSGRSSRNRTFVQFPRRSWVSVHTSKTTWTILIFFFFLFFFKQMRELKNSQQAHGNWQEAIWYCFNRFGFKRVFPWNTFREANRQQTRGFNDTAICWLLLGYS